MHGAFDQLGVDFRRGSEPATWATPGCRKRRTPTWRGAGRTTWSPSCWTGPFLVNKRWIPMASGAKYRL
jgi:hypothetical protein